MLSYVDFLTSLNDDNNTRVLFEKVLADDTGLDRGQTLDIWDRFVEFEYSRGDQSSIQKVEQRRSNLYPELRAHTSLAQMACRYRFMDMWPCDALELDMLDLEREASGSGTASSGAASKGTGEGKGEDAREKRQKTPPAEEKVRVPTVPLPPIKPALQELINCLPKMTGLPPGGPGVDEVLRMMNLMIVPPRFYTPPQTMLAGGGSFIPGSKSAPTPAPKAAGGGGGAKRNRGDGEVRGEGGGGSDLFRMRQKQRYSNIQD